LFAGDEMEGGWYKSDRGGREEVNNNSGRVGGKIVGSGYLGGGEVD